MLKSGMLKFGIYINSSSGDSILAESCLKLLQDNNLETRILTMSRSSEHGGLKVFFDSDFGKKQVLKMKLLPTTDGQNPTIHGLNTSLKVHDAIYDEKQFKEDTQTVLKNLGLERILEIKQIPFSKSFPEIGSGNWIIDLDIPEIEELDVFKTNGLPDRMSLQLPHSNNAFRVTFVCCLCGKDGHSALTCFSFNDDCGSDEDNSSRPILVTLTDEDVVVHRTESGSPSAVANHQLSVRILEASNIQTCKRSLRESIEEVDSDGASSKKLCSPSTSSTSCRGQSIVDNSSNCTSNTVEQDPIEIDLEIQAGPSASTSRGESLSSVNEDGPLHSLLRFRRSEQQKRLFRAAKTSFGNSKNTFLEQFGAGVREDRVVAVATSGQVEEEVISELPLLAGEQAVVIPRGFRSIMEWTPGVLNIAELESYFNDAKDVARPAEFAEIYTADVDGLSRQLKAILKQGKDEKDFMDWFISFLERFNGK